MSLRRALNFHYVAAQRPLSLRGFTYAERLSRLMLYVLRRRAVYCALLDERVVVSYAICAGDVARLLILLVLLLLPGTNELYGFYFNKKIYIIC